jgi:DNA repair exonuclease SbcCD ATPase subunit
LTDSQSPLRIIIEEEIKREIENLEEIKSELQRIKGPLQTEKKEEEIIGIRLQQFESDLQELEGNRPMCEAEDLDYEMKYDCYIRIVESYKKYVEECDKKISESKNRLKDLDKELTSIGEKINKTKINIEILDKFSKGNISNSETLNQKVQESKKSLDNCSSSIEEQRRKMQVHYEKLKSFRDKLEELKKPTHEWVDITPSPPEVDGMKIIPCEYVKRERCKKCGIERTEGIGGRLVKSYHKNIEDKKGRTINSLIEEFKEEV